MHASLKPRGPGHPSSPPAPWPPTWLRCRAASATSMRGGARYSFAKQVVAHYIQRLPRSRDPVGAPVHQANAIHQQRQHRHAAQHRHAGLNSARSEGSDQEDARLTFPVLNAMPIPFVEPEDISEAVVFFASTPRGTSRVQQLEGRRRRFASRRCLDAARDVSVCRRLRPRALGVPEVTEVLVAQACNAPAVHDELRTGGVARLVAGQVHHQVRYLGGLGGGPGRSGTGPRAPLDRPGSGSDPDVSSYPDPHCPNSIAADLLMPRTPNFAAV